MIFFGILTIGDSKLFIREAQLWIILETNLEATWKTNNKVSFPFLPNFPFFIYFIKIIFITSPLTLLKMLLTLIFFLMIFKTQSYPLGIKTCPSVMPSKDVHVLQSSKLSFTTCWPYQAPKMTALNKQLCPTVVQQDQWCLESSESWVQSPVQQGGLRIWHCCSGSSVGSLAQELHMSCGSQKIK